MRLRGEIFHEKGDDSCFLVGHVQVQVHYGQVHIVHFRCIAGALQAGALGWWALLS